jgi:hypothetical protein
MIHVGRFDSFGELKRHAAEVGGRQSFAPVVTA